MSKALEIAQLYFDLSNKSDFDGIVQLLTDNTTYSSQSTGEYIGKDAILAMQRAFHGKFSTLNWTVNSVKTTMNGVIVFDYDFYGKQHDGTEVHSSGLEYITVLYGKIQDVEIRSKT
jgi:hypothetical protein